MGPLDTSKFWSAYPEIPDQHCCIREIVSVVPRTDVSSRSKFDPAMKLFDQLIGASNQRGWNG
jgi:hypothetical protein